MTSSIIRANNFNNIMPRTNSGTNNGVNINATNHNSNSIIFNNNINKINSNTNNNGLRVSRNPDLKSTNKNSNLIYNIKNAVMESKYFQNITNSDLNNNNIIKTSQNSNNNANIISYNNINTNTINNNNNNNNNNQTSASLALMNKIRAIESRKKRVPTSIPTAVQRYNGFDDDLINNNMMMNQIQQPPRTPKPLNSSTPTPQYIPIATGMEINKLRKKFNNSKLESPQKNTDQFKDKLSDQKFFDRNFKISDKPTSTPLPSSTPVPTTRSIEYNGIINENHYFNNPGNSRLNTQTEATKIQINSSTPPAVSNNSESVSNSNNIASNGTSAIPISFNKLKLLKKRNLNKKMNVNVNNFNTAVKSQSNLESVGKLTDELDDVNEKNNNKNNFKVSSNTLDHYKSSQTVDESYLYEIKNKPKSSLYGLAKSSNTLNTLYTPIATPASSKAKSDNFLLELIEKSSNNDLEKEKNLLKQQNDLLPKFSSKSTNNIITTKNPFTIVATENLNSIKPTSDNPASQKLADKNRILTKSKTDLNRKTPNDGSKLDIYNQRDDSSNSDCEKQLERQKTQVNIKQTNMNNNNKVVNNADNSKQTDNAPEFRVICPGTYEIPKSSIYYYDNNNQFDDNIFMSEEFRRLFHEDEYFKEVFRKCHQWLHKHVLPNMPKITEKLKKGHKITM
jgi:hypothetical protein